jgi:hypothetical protein
MLALFLDHPPLFVAGEIALGLSLALFVGALIAAVIRGVPGISHLREPGHPNPTIVRRPVDEAVHGGGSGSDTVGSIQAAIRVTPTRRLVLGRRGPDSERLVQRKFPDKPLTSREPFARSLFARSGGGSRRGLENGQGSLIGARSAHSERSKGVY